MCAFNIFGNIFVHYFFTMFSPILLELNLHDVSLLFGRLILPNSCFNLEYFVAYNNWK